MMDDTDQAIERGKKVTTFTYYLNILLSIFTKANSHFILFCGFDVPGCSGDYKCGNRYFSSSQGSGLSLCHTIAASVLNLNSFS